MFVSSCGMSGITVGWVKSWLKGRAQRVVVNGATRSCHQWCSSGLSARAGSVQCLDKRRLRANLIAFYSFLERGSGEGGDDLPGIQ